MEYLIDSNVCANEDLYAQLGILKKKSIFLILHMLNTFNVIYYETVNRFRRNQYSNSPSGKKGNCLNKVSVPCLAPARCFYCAKPAFPAYSEYDEWAGRWYRYRCPFNCWSEKGIVYNVANISSWKRNTLEGDFGEQFKGQLPLIMIPTVSLWGEPYGEGKSYTNMVGVTIGTGIGAMLSLAVVVWWWAIYGSRWDRLILFGLWFWTLLQ